MVNDTHLQLEVIAELNWEPSVTAAHIGVAASAGVITLTGEVESYAEKHAAVGGFVPLRIEGSGGPS
ncbi:MAG TPA: BON domain-containing protein [Devosia sp.]|nr:BON domain-containing protein [Devosia sp.]